MDLNTWSAARRHICPTNTSFLSSIWKLSGIVPIRLIHTSHVGTCCICFIQNLWACSSLTDLDWVILDHNSQPYMARGKTIDLYILKDEHGCSPFGYKPILIKAIKLPRKLRQAQSITDPIWNICYMSPLDGYNCLLQISQTGGQTDVWNNVHSHKNAVLKWRSVSANYLLLGLVVSYVTIDTTTPLKQRATLLRYVDQVLRQEESTAEP